LAKHYNPNFTNFDKVREEVLEEKPDKSKVFKWMFTVAALSGFDLKRMTEYRCRWNALKELEQCVIPIKPILVCLG